MKAAVATLLALLLAGCADGADPQPPAPPCQARIAAACGDLLDLGMVLEGCVESAFTLELAQKVYDLPDGYTDSPFLASPQRVPLALDKCAAVRVGDWSAPASVGYAGILVNAPARGQPEDTQVLDLEVFTNDTALAELFEGFGFNVVLAEFSIVDDGPRRSVAVTGGVAYAADIQYSPLLQPGIMDLADVHTSATHWYYRERQCDIYAGTGTVQFQASQGRLTEAMAGPLPLQGRGTQSSTCDARVSFGRLA